MICWKYRSFHPVLKLTFISKKCHKVFNLFPSDSPRVRTDLAVTGTLLGEMQFILGLAGLAYLLSTYESSKALRCHVQLLHAHAIQIHDKPGASLAERYHDVAASDWSRAIHTRVLGRWIR